tara:strand:- start:290 stop:652 length:363 start_codon:yes stop_codon:yes gene_type:complete
MKTLLEITTKEKELIKSGEEIRFENTKESKELLTKHRKELKELKKVRLYLETEPNEEFIKADLIKYEKISIDIESRFLEWIDNTPRIEAEDKDVRANFMKTTRLKKTKEYIKTLKFILND